jgi:di/tripeptidase
VHGLPGLEVSRTVISVRARDTARESAPTLILQGHLAMVCERELANPNDPAEGRIELQQDPQ